MNQLESINLNAIEGDNGRLSLTVVRQAKKQIDAETIAKQPTALKAFNLMVEMAGIDNEILAEEVNMDSAQFNRCKSGKNNYPLNKLNVLMDACGNEVFLQWLAQSRGYGLVRLKTAVEAELEEQRKINLELQQKLAHFSEFITIAKER